LFVIVVLGLLALAFWLSRRFGGGRLGGGATRGRQLRLAVTKCPRYPLTDRCAFDILLYTVPPR